jgi:nucleotide-binding universal stress UspA family protein/predicted transcriptional regulator
MAQTIVVPLDGSELGETALPWAALLARTRGCSITLVRIVPWPDLPAGEFGEYFSPNVYDDVVAAEIGAAQEYLDGLKGRFSADGVTVDTVVREGMAAEGIHDVADELGAYAVAMASHGRGGVARIVLGSVAERLLHQATVPVFLIRAGGPKRPASLNRIVVPLDGSTLAERGFDQAREIAGPDTTLVLVRVVEPVYDMMGSEDTTLIENTEATDQEEIEARQYLDNLMATPGPGSGKMEIVLRRGRSGHALLEAIRDSNADAVVMTTHGRTGPTRWIMGSVADEVFRHTDRPVMLVSARMLTARVVGRFLVRDLMTKDVEFVDENETVLSVVRKVLRRRVSGAPVLNKDGHLVGIISEHALLNWHTRVVEELAKDEDNLDPVKYAERVGSDTIKDLFTKPAISIDESADLSSATRMLIDHRIRRLAVTSNGRLVGVISRADILKGMAANWETLAVKE